MSTRPRGLGRGLGALIPQGPTAAGPLPEPPTADRPASTSEVRPGATGRAAEDGLAPAAATTGGEQFHRASGGAAGGEESSAERAPQSAATDGTPVQGASFAELPLDAVVPNPRQPRQVFDEDALAELVVSLREVGLLQPVVVRPVGEGRYELVMGERRWRAAREAGFTTIPAIVRSTDDDDMLRDALLENLHRQQLNPLEEAAAYDQLLRDFGITHEELAGRIGRSRSQVSNTIRLMKLPPAVQRRVAAGVLSAGHARALLSLDDPAAQDRLAVRIVAEGLSVRAVEELVLVGETGRAPTGRPGARPGPPAELQAVAGRLADRFETRVKVEMGQRRGKIVVEFASMEDLERILGVMSPQVLEDGEPVG